MAVVIRLQRKGKPKRPFYRLVAIEKSRGSAGKSLEILGSYDPRVEDPKKKVQLKRERYEAWIKNGALPSDTVRNLVKQNLKEAAAS